MAQDNVNISLDAQQSGRTKSELKNLINKLEKINKMSNIELAMGSKEQTSQLKESTKLSDKKAKSQKVYAQGLQLQIKLQGAINKGHQDTYNRLLKLQELNRKGEVLTQNQLKYVDLIDKKETSKNKTLNETVAIKNKLNKISEKEQNSLKEQLRTQELMLEKMKKGVSGKSGYEDLTQSISKYQEKVKAGNILTKEEVHNLKMLETQTRANTSVNDKLAESATKIAAAYSAWAGIRTITRQVREQIKELATLDEYIFNLGVVSGKSASETNKLRREMLEMAQSVPQSAEQVSDALDLIVRTGKKVPVKNSFLCWKLLRAS